MRPRDVLLAIAAFAIFVVWFVGKEPGPRRARGGLVATRPTAQTSKIIVLSDKNARHYAAVLEKFAVIGREWDDPVHVAALKRLAQADPDRARPLITGLLDTRRHSEALTALWLANEPEDCALLADLWLRSPDDHRLLVSFATQARGRDCLPELAARRAAAPLVERALALRAQLEAPSLVEWPYVSQPSRSLSPYMRPDTWRSWERLHQKPDVVAGLRDPNPEVRLHAILWSTRADQRADLERWLEVATSDPHPLIRREALRELGWARDARVLGVLKAHLDDEPAAAAQSLAWYGDEGCRILAEYQLEPGVIELIRFTGRCTRWFGGVRRGGG